MKKIIYLLISIIIILLILIFYNIFFQDKETESLLDKQIKNLELDNITNLMVVAHPDDETIWGGAHLLEGNYLVVCITCGTDQERLEEYKKVMELTKNEYLYLGYPDKTNGERDNWDTVYESIIDDLKRIYELNDWDMVVTHNPEGEYGHIHHIMTNAIMTDDVVDNKDILYYFGKYYSKKKMKSEKPKLKRISDKEYEEKMKLIDVYVTQEFIKTKFDQMFPYENFTSYKKWNSK